MTDERVERLVADLEIRRTLTDYAAMVDARDFDRLRCTFADDVCVNYHNGRTIVTGGDEVVDYIRTNTSHLLWQHHNVSVYGVDVDGDAASAQVYLLSHQVVAADPTHVLMMAARYQVRLGRGADGDWRIREMVHTIQLVTHHPVVTESPVPVEIPAAVRPGL